MLREPLQQAHGTPREIDLDPENWEHFATVAHQALDEGIALLRDVRQRPPWRPVPDEVHRHFERPVPRQGTDVAAVYEQVRKTILPYPTGNIHPRFWGWVMGNGTAEGLIAEIVATAMNNHLAGYDQSAARVERQVIRWLLDVFGYPAEGSGILVSGGTVANLNGVAVARKAKADWDIRDEGLAGGPPLRFYGSDQTHSWAEKAADLLGLGRRGFVRVASDSNGRVDLEALASAVQADRQAGRQPFCVVGNAGTVNFGVIDDLEVLADFCAAEGLWFHIDGAFGALVALDPGLRPRLRGLERSDSLAFDLHKWGYLQYELGCTLVRNATAHRTTFEASADYLQAPGRGIQPDKLDLAELGIQLSRGFRALKVWTAFQVHGIDKIGRVIAQNVEQARALAQRVELEPELELMAPVPLNIVCFRFQADALSDETLDTVNREILVRLQEDGIAVPSSTLIGGHFALRVAITNHRSTRADFDALVESTLVLGREVLESGLDGALRSRPTAPDARVGSTR